jgi:RNA recognition motif-containing protein
MLFPQGWAAVGSFAFQTWQAAMLALSCDPESDASRRLRVRSVPVGMRLYVGNLSYNVTNESLEELFAQFGAVKSAQVIMDRDTGRSKGFGFVEMADDNAARDAIAGLNETTHDGRPLTVNEARPREERGGGGGGRSGGGGRGYGGGGGGGGGYGGGRGGGGGGGGGRRY